MRLTAHTDYALRILLHAALTQAQDPDALLSIAEVAEAHAISRNHAMKVVNALGNAGLLETLRGRGGGFRLGRPADEIRLGDVVRLTEPNLQPADCGSCVMQRHCGLISPLDRAVHAFLAELDKQTLAQAAVESRLPAMAAPL
ncbi:Rrf2 family transcriptional regulator [Novosphingobium pentaromativorans]|uniref:BadM/Rrf2 family transcriptional regulator n=1 Tax=Novosphingobium pentaromativorans US6-1 TaxID=1088721 RepID=G6E982_9SPHN|nr:Rrf2 family transcriptional regulator [Novosphingobium pentaromativorans]AIT81104.1 Rrf2 family transcriptional regulator [Novosphingobium pentaromativorans US6-1]EHJ62306.1 BadM/Rrf2 family transcriptional regulator [Novosphingobium pentaromativorans US6-1]